MVDWGEGDCRRLGGRGRWRCRRRSRGKGREGFGVEMKNYGVNIGTH